jgi:GNAT superfamily N-acetyltransferase
MVDIVTFDPQQHLTRWEAFILSSYQNPNYVLLSPDYLRWQFLDNPANDTGGYTLWLVIHRNAVVAQLGYVPFQGISPDGERFPGAYPINLIVLPEYRSAGLGPIMLSRLLKQTPCVLNPGSSEAGASLCMGLGMHDLGILRRYIAVTDAVAARTLAADGHLPSGLQPIDLSGSPFRSDVVTLLPDGVSAFSVPAPVYGAERSRAFLRWRYETHPGFRYEFLLSNNCQSVLVLHEERESGTGVLVIRVVDFLAAADDQDALLGTLLRTAQQRKAAIVDFFCSVDCYDDSLKRAGFFNEAEHKDIRIAALFQPLDFRKTGIRVLASHPTGLPTSAKDWYVAKGDSDQDRPNDKRLIPSA